MVFSQNCYSVLIVSDSAKLNETLAGLLPAGVYTPVRVATSVAAAKRALLERVFDLVIVNAPLPDETGTAFAADQCANRETAALVLVKAALYASVSEQSALNGVFTLPKPTTAQALGTAIRWLTAARERLRRVGEREVSVEEKMREIQLINRAKWKLIEEEGLTEPEAHRRIEKLAMDRCLPKAQIAKELLGP